MRVGLKNQKQVMMLAKRQMIVLGGGADGGGFGGLKHTLIIDTTQILNNFEYISRTVNYLKIRDTLHTLHSLQYIFFVSLTFLM